MDPRSTFLRPRTRNHLDTGGVEFAGYPGANPQTVDVRIAPLTRSCGDQSYTGGVGGSTIDLTIGAAPPNLLLENCRGFRLINVAGAVAVNINGGGLTTVVDRDVWDFWKIRSLTIYLAAGATATIQQWAE